MPFRPEPPAPTAPELRNAHLVLTHTLATANSFLQILGDRVDRRGRGAPTDHDYDLLPAMLLFACAGPDSMIKHAIRDALPAVVDHVDAAQDSLRVFVERRLRTDRGLPNDLLAPAPPQQTPAPPWSTSWSAT